jgi:hypothetical protein
MSDPPAPRKPRTWLDALIATTLRWNDRLGKEVVAAATAAEPAAGAALRDGSEGRAALRAPLPPPSRGR